MYFHYVLDKIFKKNIYLRLLKYFDIGNLLMTGNIENYYLSFYMLHRNEKLKNSANEF